MITDRRGKKLQRINWSNFRQKLDSNQRPVPRIEETQDIDIATQAVKEEINKTQGNLQKFNKCGDMPQTTAQQIEELQNQKNTRKTKHSEDKRTANILNGKKKEALNTHFNK